MEWPTWPVFAIREMFFSYLGGNAHAKLSSTPVIPIDDPKVPLIHACLNRFKGALGTGRHRCCFSLRCIITSSDDDVIEHFRSDTTYHRFTEILGSWSCGDYLKEEAIELLLRLLSTKYELPESRIHATYFGGGTSSGLSPDNESKTALQKCIGEERILPSMSKEDFWMSGETGPCGPSVGIFIDGSNSQDGVNGKLIEISRLVFVEFNRQADGVLSPLQAKHILTGINLQCLAAILQNKGSHYEVDYYEDIIECIYDRSSEEIEIYSGKVGDADIDGVDTAYRLLADHMRMIAVTNAPGSQLGLRHEGRVYFLKCADKLAVQYGHEVLKIHTKDAYDDIVYTSLLDSDLCPELDGYRKKDQIQEDEVMIYLKTIAELRDQNLPFDMAEKKKKKKDATSEDATSENATSVVWYATRVIEFLGRRTPIVLKNKNTRCSLVALCNVLLLGGKITLNLDINKVSEGHLIYLVQSYLLYGNIQMQLEQNLELSEFNKQVLGVLPKLPGSLYFDVKFASSCGFEQTLETTLFGFLGVPLHHGWTVDSQDVEFGSSIHRSSYLRLSVTLAVYESLLPGPQKHVGCEDDMFYSALAFSSTEPEELISCARISTFLRGPQLTPYGFSSLKNDLKERQPSLLLWNETLLTISKVEDKIFVLLNDISLLSTHTDAVWEMLTEGNDYGYFVDCNFIPTNSTIQSILPLTKNERKKWKKKAKMGLKGPLVPKDKEEDRNEDRKEDRNEEKDDEKNEEKDDEKTEKDDEKTKEKDDGKAEEKDENIQEEAIISGNRGNLKMRAIDFFGRSTHVIHQKHDGPCALIAICNVLLLKGAIFFEACETKVSIDYLLNLVYSLISGSAKMQAHCSEIQKAIWDVAPTLAKGFDVDIIFTRTDGFTESPEWLLLDCLDLNVRHGWVATRDLLPGPEVSLETLSLAACEPDFPHAETIQKFLRGQQLTPIGLVALHEDLVENVPCIMYWHYHYNTIVKVNGVVHSLVTNSNYLRTNVVWQTLEVNGGGVYLDSNFTPIYTDAAPLGSISVPETSTSEASTSLMKPDSEGITSHGDGLCLDRSFTQLYSAPDVAPLRDNVHGSHVVPRTWTPGSCACCMRPYTEEDISHEKYVTGPQIVPETWEISLKEFVEMPGNGFSELKTLFADGTSLDVAATTKIGRVLGLDVLEDIVFSHKAGLSWNGNFDLTTIVVIGGARAEIRAPYCDKFCREATRNDFFSYVSRIVELFKIEGVGLPAFFKHLINKLSNPPRRPSVCNERQLVGFQRRLNGFWDCVLTTLALRSPLARAGLFSGIHRIRRFAEKEVRHALRAVLSSTPHLKSDWRAPIAETGHPVVKKVLRYIPGILDGSNENAMEGEDPERKFGLYKTDVGSLSVFPRQVNEHGKSKEDLGLELQPEEEKEYFKKLSELDLLTSHYLEGSLPAVLEKLLCSNHLMTADLWEWLEEVLEEYIRSEGTWSIRHRVFGWNLRRRVRCRVYGQPGRGRAQDFGHRGRACARGFGHRGRACARGFGHHGRGRGRGF